MLIRVCHAQESLREQFIHSVTKEPPSTEFRFGGLLGFGGKFYYRRDRLYVACYPEDINVVRAEAIQKANAELDGLAAPREA